MRGWYRDHIGKFRGQNQNSNPKASPKLPGAHQWVLFFRVHLGWGPGEENLLFFTQPTLKTLPLTTLSFFGRQMRKLPYQSSLQFIQRPQLLWNDIGDRKLWRGIQWIRRGPTVPSRLSWNAYQSNIPKPRSGVRWKHGMRRFSEYGNVASRIIYHILWIQDIYHIISSKKYHVWVYIYIMYVYVYIAYACIMPDVYTVCHIYIYVCAWIHIVYIYTHT